MPDAVRYEPGEVETINRIRVANYYGIRPDEVDDMPLADFMATLGVMEGDALASKWRNRPKTGKQWN